MVRLAAVRLAPLLALAACGAGGGAPRLEANVGNGGVTFVSTEFPNFASTLVLGPPRAADYPPQYGMEAIAVEWDWKAPEPARVVARAQPSERGPVETRVAITELPEGYSTVQWLVHGSPPGWLPVVAAGEPLHLWRSGERCEVLGTIGYLWQSRRGTWLAIAGVAALLGLAIATRPLPPRALRAVILVAGLAAAMGFLGLRWRALPFQRLVDQGEVPPLLPSTTWRIAGDGEERVLGPGFRALSDAITKNRRPGEALQFVVFDERHEDYPGARTRASYLRRVHRDAKFPWDPGRTEAGLAIYFGGDPRGETLAKTEVGVLTRIATEPK